MEYFKNRKFIRDVPVEVYRNLNKKGKIYSFRQRRLVIAHSDNFVLKDCTFIINESGRQRCIDTKQRNVHAFIRGYLGSTDDISSSFGFLIRYRPFNKLGFYNMSLGTLEKCNVVYTSNGNLYIQN